MKEKLLFNSIEAVLDKSFFLSDVFKKLLIKLNVDELWETATKLARNERAIITLTDWDDKYDSWYAFRYCVNSQTSVNRKILLVASVLKEYVIYSSRSISLMNIKESFSIMGATDEDLSLLDTVSSEVTLEMNNMENIIEQSDMVHRLYKSMNEEFYKGNYESCNTYAYTLIEGVLKNYLTHFQIPFDGRRDDIRKMATLVRDDIKRNRMVNDLLDDSNGLKQITTIADIIDKCRNRASISHFDLNSDMVTSGFVKDLSVSVANMLIRILRM